MSLSDPIADMLTRVRNGLRVGRPEVLVKASKTCEGIAKVLKEAGYITDYDRIDDGNQGFVRIVLKYDLDGRPVIDEIKRVSRPGKRIYNPVDKLPYVMSGMGIVIVSTSKGVIDDKSCRQMNVSGEVLCTVS